MTDQAKVGGFTNAFRRVSFENWRRIGKITFDSAALSYNGDFVIHFHHPRWRKDTNDPATEVGALTTAPAGQGRVWLQASVKPLSKPSANRPGRQYWAKLVETRLPAVTKGPPK